MPLPRIDSPKETKRIIAFIKKIVADASAGGVVVGLSGGVDSSVVGALCVRALGKERVHAGIMPSDFTPNQDIEDAKALAESWQIRSSTVQISSLVRSLGSSVGIVGTKVAKANAGARIRMAILYYYANSLGYLVAGTGDRSESLLGYFTKWGDGGSDFMPIAHLYKTQVRELGAYLRLPKGVVEKPASPQLWAGQKATDEIPADYDKLDIVLHSLFDSKAPKAMAAKAAGVPLRVVDEVLEMHNRSAHKRVLPPSLVEEILGFSSHISQRLISPTQSGGRVSDHSCLS
ncbi:MAG TPA: NAD+ synthase [Nitrososphaerales archaeon]|nr:NAD+ synthase [Nitrososphaerales archaeon]